VLGSLEVLWQRGWHAFVLIGDAAGHNDPTVGQGLSITMRDARMVAEALSSTTKWEDGLFAAYAAERRERMRRLRHFARVTAVLRCEFDEEGDRRRTEVASRAAHDPITASLFTTGFMGPFAVPDEAFGEPTLKKLFGEQWSMTSDGWLQRSNDNRAVT
jgi:2-polyprenyl-6-methoxyphenol hydroxylase-like FAD-dependent oxidoreductase